MGARMSSLPSRRYYGCELVWQDCGTGPNLPLGLQVHREPPVTLSPFELAVLEMVSRRSDRFGNRVAGTLRTWRAKHIFGSFPSIGESVIVAQPA
jgi:hypothetical protein